MKSANSGKIAGVVASCSAGAFLTLVVTASPAAADPVDPVAPPVPATTAAAPPAANVQSASTDMAPPPPAEVPHLASPDALPPGSTMDPGVMGGEDPNVSYLKDLWHAVQSQEISGKEALLLGLSQRGMNTPYPSQAPGPTVPISPGNPALPPPPAPAPAPGLPPPPMP